MGDENTSNHNDNTEYIEHTKKYTDLLKGFIDNMKSANKVKNVLKVAFFVIIVLIMISLMALFSYSTYKALDIIKNLDSQTNDKTESIVGAVSSIIPSLATMIVSLIKLPEIIAHYLFNPEEDKNMVAIIEKIQNYDLQMYSLEKDVERLLMKDQSISNSSDKPLQELLEAQEPSSDTTNNGPMDNDQIIPVSTAPTQSVESQENDGQVENSQ